MPPTASPEYSLRHITAGRDIFQLGTKMAPTYHRRDRFTDRLIPNSIPLPADNDKICALLLAQSFTDQLARNHSLK